MADPNLGPRLSAWRKALRWTQSEVSEKIGVLRSVYKNWEYGQSMPPASVMVKLHALGFRPDDVGPPTIPAVQLLAPLRHIGPVSAGVKVDWADPFESETFEYVPPEMADARGRFSARISGDSMFDFLWPDDLCVFQRTDVPKIGGVVLWRSFDNTLCVKTLKHTGSDLFLHSYNPRYEPIRADGIMVGYLVGIVREQGSRRVTVYDAHGLTP